MTFTVIVNKVANRMNLTSAVALARIGDTVNEGYKELMAELRMKPTVVSANTVIGNQEVTFTGVEKLFSVFDPAFTPPRPLGLFSVDQLRNMPLRGDPPSNYAITLWGASTVTIKLDSIPATIYALGADAGPNLMDIAGSQIPAFTESFQNALVYKGMAIELDKMEKWQAADRKKQEYGDRVNDLKHYIASSSYTRMYQGAYRTRR